MAAVGEKEYMAKPRKYQEEMLRMSLNQNIIVAMDTGSGKTAIAILRIREELERASKGKTIWFLCPTVALAEQQFSVIKQDLLATPARLLSSKDDVDTWKTHEIWENALRNIDIIVCTHQVLVDALSHGFIQMSSIALLVFDEAHHCSLRHPANRLLQAFYHPLKRERPADVPHILGLTASPVFGNKQNALRIIEQNLDAISRTPKLHRDELMRFVHRPVMGTVLYTSDECPWTPLLTALYHIHQAMDIREDPYMLNLATKDPHLYKQTLLSQKTYTQDQMKTFVKEAERINRELGNWASMKFVSTCVLRYSQARRHAAEMLQGSDQEKQYLCSIISALDLENPNLTISIGPNEVSSKMQKLVDILEGEITAESAGIIFVKRRADVALISMILSCHSATKDFLRVGTFIGTSEFLARSGTLAKMIETKNEESTLDDLQSGVKNLIVCTSVCEEGIDISACNFVICFDAPDNLKSFIQRRGRARHAQSRFTLMLEKGGAKSVNIVSQWLELEKRMEEQYMDDMRQLKVLTKLESEDDGYRELIIESTGAKLTLQNAVQHLHHFCDKLPQAEYTTLKPIFSYESKDDQTFEYLIRDRKAPRSIYCNVILPNAVDVTIRESRSQGCWSSEKMARSDAAFEAYVKLYGAGLVNSHLLPSPHIDAEVARTYTEIAKRPAEVEIFGQFNPWLSITHAWTTTSKVFQYTIAMTLKNEEICMLQMLTPLLLPPLPTFKLYIDAGTSYDVKLSGPVEHKPTTEEIDNANNITRVLLYSAYRSKMSVTQSGFPLLFTPTMHDTDLWLKQMSGGYPAVDLLVKGGMKDEQAVGIIRDAAKYGGQYLFETVEWKSIAEENEGVPNGVIRSKQYLRCRSLPKRRDFLHPIPAEQLNPVEKTVWLDPETCSVDYLPSTLTRLATFIPSIIHKIGISLTATDLCRTILAPVNFTNPSVVLPAISTASAQEPSNYQRLEFLGDAILKTLTSSSLVADHPKWHEKYLSNQKDHIVSNGRLAMAAQVIGLDRYILTNAFTGQKWKPSSNESLLLQAESPQRTMSTKTLADVIEALLGAAYLDGGFPKALCLLRICIPEISWQSLESWSSTLLSHAMHIQTPAANRVSDLENLIDYKFSHISLLVEAITHPSYPSTSLSQSTSYQRFEFLGDALLDYIVTTAIYKHDKPPLSLHRMHLLRTATVNADFLAFRALTTTITITAADDFITPSLLSFLRAAPSTDLMTALNAARFRFNQVSPQITAALDSPKTYRYPWRSLAAMNPEKVISDLVESVIAAVWIDSGGSFTACEKVLAKLGIMDFVQSRLEFGGEGLWHPKEEIGMWAGNRTVEYDVRIADKEEHEGELGDDDDASLVANVNNRANGLGRRHICRLLIDAEHICYGRGSNKLEAEIAAAENGIELLKAMDARRGGYADQMGPG